MRILVATDAWHPQVNGVVRRLDRAKVREDAFRFSWARTAELFLHNIINACGYAEVARSPRNVVRSAARPSTSRFTPKTT